MKKNFIAFFLFIPILSFYLQAANETDIFGIPINEEETVLIEEQTEEIIREESPSAPQQPHQIELQENTKEIPIVDDRILDQALKLDHQEEDLESLFFEEIETVKEEEIVEEVREKTIFPSYVSTPKKIYIGQIFPVTIKTILDEKKFVSIDRAFVNGNNFNVLESNATWQKENENTYKYTFYMKLSDSNAVIPDIKISVKYDDGYIDSETLEKFNVRRLQLKQDKYFSSVLAEDLKVINQKATKFDDESNIIVAEINAIKGNLEDFHLDYVMRDGIDSQILEFPQQTIFYFAIVPKDLKKFQFKYFNIKENRFKSYSLPVTLSDNRLSTQLGLNPKESKYILYRTIALIVTAFLIMLLYLKYRKIYLVIFSAAILIYVAYDQIPVSNIVIKAKTSVTILPTDNSTVFYETEKQTDAEVLYKRGIYIKVLLPNKKIGWIKDEDIAKN